MRKLSILSIIIIVTTLTSFCFGIAVERHRNARSSDTLYSVRKKPAVQLDDRFGSIVHSAVGDGSWSKCSVGGNYWFDARRMPNGDLVCFTEDAWKAKPDSNVREFSK